MTTEQIIESPTAWFAEMEVAIRRRQFDRAAIAQRELRRLGVVVEFDRDPPPMRLVPVDPDGGGSDRRPAA